MNARLRNVLSDLVRCVYGREIRGDDYLPAQKDQLMLDAKKEIERLTRELEQTQEALVEARAGKPLGPLVEAQTIMNQQNDIQRLTRERDHLLEQCGQASVRAEQAEDRAERMECERDNARALLRNIHENLQGHSTLSRGQMESKIQMIHFLTSFKEN